MNEQAPPDVYTDSLGLMVTPLGIVIDVQLRPPLSIVVAATAGGATTTVSEDEQDTKAARSALAEAEREGVIPWESIKADLGLGR